MTCQKSLPNCSCCTVYYQSHLKSSGNWQEVLIEAQRQWNVDMVSGIQSSRVMKEWMEPVWLMHFSIASLRFLYSFSPSIKIDLFPCQAWSQVCTWWLSERLMQDFIWMNVSYFNLLLENVCQHITFFSPPRHKAIVKKTPLLHYQTTMLSGGTVKKHPMTKRLNVFTCLVW